MVSPDAIELLPKLVWHYDQPFADSSAIPSYLVAQLTREHVKVALTGDGGDELFAGYERFAAARLAEIYRRTPQLLRSAVKHTLDSCRKRRPTAALSAARAVLSIARRCL